MSPDLDQPGITFVDIAAIPAGPGGEATSASEASKRNALTHALTAKKVFPAELAAEIRECIAELTFAYQPEHSYEQKMVAEMGRIQAQLARCRQMIVDDICRRSSRAVDHWDSDRRQEALALAARLPREPWLIKPALERSKQGVDWMIEEFTTLQTMIVQNGGWNDAQRQRAFDLLGVRAEDREGFGIVPAPTDAQALLALAERELSRLRTLLKERLLGLDEADQMRAVQGFPGPEDADAKKLRKYEAKLKGDWNWARNELLWLRGVCNRPGATRPDHPGPMAGVDDWLKWIEETFYIEIKPEAEPVPAAEAEPEPVPDEVPPTMSPAEEPAASPPPVAAATTAPESTAAEPAAVDAASPAPTQPAIDPQPAPPAADGPPTTSPNKPNSRQTDKGRKKRDARKSPARRPAATDGETEKKPRWSRSEGGRESGPLRSSARLARVFAADRGVRSVHERVQRIPLLTTHHLLLARERSERPGPSPAARRIGQASARGENDFEGASLESMSRVRPHGAAAADALGEERLLVEPAVGARTGSADTRSRGSGADGRGPRPRGRARPRAS